jgi:hypothetical protein
MWRLKLQVYGSVSALFCLLSINTAHAYRPFDGTDADVAELGEFELEMGPAHLLHESGRNFLMSPTVFNLGIAPRTELVIDMVGFVPLHPLAATPFERGEAKLQLLDTDVFFKVLLRKGALQDEGGISIAFEGGPLLPEIYGAKGYGAAGNLIISDRWGWFTAHLNNTLELARGSGDPVWANNLIFEFQLSEHFRPVTELTWERDIRGGSNLFAALAGFIWTAVDDFDIDAAALVSTEDGEQAIEGRLGFTWAVAFWEPAEVPPDADENNAHEPKSEDEVADPDEEEQHASN